MFRLSTILSFLIVVCVGECLAQSHDGPAQRAPVEFLIIDEVERPSPD